MLARIDEMADVESGLEALVVIDPRLAAVRAAAGHVELRRRPAGFPSLASIIVSQQVSLASASAIMGRLCLLIDPLDPQGVLEAGEPVLVEAGLSRAKQRALMALAQAVASGELDLEVLCQWDVEEATAAITALPGLGPWSAQVYLLTCAGHARCIPCGRCGAAGCRANGFRAEGAPDIARTFRHGRIMDAVAVRCRAAVLGFLSRDEGTRGEASCLYVRW